MPTFACATCGESFSLPQHVVDRHPGWTPRTCRSCRDGGGNASSRAGGAERRSASPRRRASRGATLVEENLTLAQVLDKYTEGPTDGVFTDGSANPNPGPGGWGAVYVVGGAVVDQAHGHEPHTTNNRMELTALIAGFDLVPPGTATTVYSDSRLCVDTITKWAAGWERRGWRRKGGEVLNLDLVKALYERAKARPELRLQWIAAHNGARWNEYADSLSTAYLRAEL